MNPMTRFKRTFAEPRLPRAAVACMLLLSMQTVSAAKGTLDFAVNEGWTMPMMHITDFRPESGILFDIMQSVAHHVGLEARYHVMPRLRIQSALERGEVDMHCYSSQAWYPDLSGDYLWSLPILYQREIGRAHV